ncbi:MAG: PDZ domain-containing protein [Deltaproteobacteria bacterium]|nr:PDZ domain-containing protein [Deltaproteobacteria bacterium]
MRFLIRALSVSCACLAMGIGGFYTSKLRAQRAPEDLIAAAGADRGLFGAAEGGSSEGDYRISALSVFSTVALHVKDNYVDPSRIHPKEMLVAALDELEREVPEVLVEPAGEGKVRVGVPQHERVFEIGDVESLWEVNLRLREIFRFLEKNMPTQKDPRNLEYAAVNGALSTLDPHSVLLKPEAFAEMKTSTKGEFGGLGIVISVREGKLTIMSPLDGTPATRAGLKALDVIERIGDVSTVSMPIEDAVRRLRGPEGSKVTIWVSRKGWPEPRKFTLTREIIKIESVEGKLLSDSIGYVRIKNFQQNTGDDLESTITKLQKENKAPLKGLVLDLRNNPGGLLEQAIRVSDTFLSSGDIVTTVGYGNKLREPKRAQWSGSDIDIPVGVIVNNGSASASEIVAGALKNLDRAVIVGERTFGKGSVQVLYDFPDSSALKLTIAQYLTPGNISIQNVGVAPDVALTPAWIDDDLVRLFSKPDEHREDALEKHLDRSEPPPEERPAYALTYLVEKKDVEPETDEEGETETEAPAYDTIREDLLIRFTRDLLVAAGRSKRSETIKAAQRFVSERTVAEEERITQAIQKLGIPWTKGLAARSERSIDSVRAELRIVEGASEKGDVSAGSEVKVEAKVTNGGSTPIARIRGEIDTDNPAFRGRGEMLFGTLEPGASRVFAVKTKIPKEASSRSDILTLKLDSDDGPISAEPKLALTTQYVPHPAFAYAYVINDTDRGDGDGLLERGEGIRLDVLITNIGAGNADAVTARLKTGAGEDLFLEKGRVELGTVAAGDTKVASLEFRVPDALKSNQLPVELTVWDGATGEWLEDEITLEARDPATVPVAKKSGLGVTTQLVPVHAGASPDSPAIATLPAGAVVKSDAAYGPYLRVPLLAGTTRGFVRADQVQSKKPKKSEEPVATFFPMRRPPDIRLDGQPGGRVVATPTLELSGTVLGRSLRDVYVVSNDQKLFYEAAPEALAPKGLSSTWVPPNDSAVSLPFKTTIPLVEGQNKIVIIARLDERVMTLRTIFVSRIDSTATLPVAEASAPPTSAADAKPN